MGGWDSRQSYVIGEIRLLIRCKEEKKKLKLWSKILSKKALPVPRKRARVSPYLNGQILSTGRKVRTTFQALRSGFYLNKRISGIHPCIDFEPTHANSQEIN